MRQVVLFLATNRETCPLLDLRKRRNGCHGLTVDHNGLAPIGGSRGLRGGRRHRSIQCSLGHPGIPQREPPIPFALLAHSRDIGCIIDKEGRVRNRDQQRGDMIHDRTHPCDGIRRRQWRSRPLRPVPLIKKASHTTVLGDPVPCAHQRGRPLIKKTSTTCGAEIDRLDILEKEAESGVNDILEGGRSMCFVPLP